MVKENARDRFDKVAELVEGFETPSGLELLSTTHWVMAQDDTKTVEEVIQNIYAWNDRKKQFTPRQIALAVDVLLKKGWVKNKAFS